MNLLSSRYARAVTVFLLVQGVVFYAVGLRAETTPPVVPLSTLANQLGSWQLYKEVQIDQETLDVLKADDTLNRVYVDPAKSASAFLFVAFFKTQRAGQSPHSPKNCLPANGYEPLESGPLEVAIPGRETPIVINRYLTARGDEKSVTLYWYQSHDRVIAGEFAARFWLIADSIRFRRSDTSLVKVVVPVRNNDADAATRTGVEFVKTLFPPLARQLPS